MNLKLGLNPGGVGLLPDAEGQTAKYASGLSARDDGRFEAVELSIRDEGSVTGIGLRSVPLGRIEAFVNQPDVAATMREKMHDEQGAQVAARQQKKLTGALNALAPRIPYDFEDDPDAWAGPKRLRADDPDDSQETRRFLYAGRGGVSGTRQHEPPTG